MALTEIFVVIILHFANEWLATVLSMAVPDEMVNLFEAGQATPMVAITTLLSSNELCVPLCVY